MTILSGKTKIVGVWGHPVSHSRSPAMHNAALAALGLDWVYVPFDVDPADVAAALNGVRALGLVGVNVTVPLKEAVPTLLDVVDAEAWRIGSVNTIHNIAGVLHGYSTDGPGFLRSLEALNESTEGRQVLLLGAGGSARAVAFALAGRGSHVWIANRTAGRAEALADLVNRSYPGSATTAVWGEAVGTCDVLVNTTSLGMAPQEDVMPSLAPGTLHPDLLVYDLIYAPPETRLMAEARRAGCRKVINGVGMLVAQGALSLSLWTGLPVEDMPLKAMTQAVWASLVPPEG